MVILVVGEGRVEGMWEGQERKAVCGVKVLFKRIFTVVCSLAEIVWLARPSLSAQGARRRGREGTV